MFEIPLFPLNLVLFPGTPVHLHIFEERYKQMIAHCRETGAPFGVVLIRQGMEALGSLAEPHLIGCSAQIAHIQPLEEGRMNLVALGEERFRIIRLKRERPYLVGIVESNPMWVESETALLKMQTHLSPWLERYVQMLSKGNEVQVDFGRIAQEPLIYANMAAMLLQIPLDQKQQLLEINEAVQFTSQLKEVYRREVALVRAMLEEKPGGDTVFSLN
ncbi:MAG: LON peptidase substrate-binding domain-containing protein [Anaerolineales bacterium]|nr:LON peptidase substrate-binding domain-containing protein [Anaerolineales bacterium]